MKLEFSRQIFEKYSNTNFHENPSCGSRVVPCGRTDMKEMIVAFRNFANAPKKRHNIHLIFVVPCIMLNSEIIPKRCNNCVYSSQWLYSICFG